MRASLLSAALLCTVGAVRETDFGTGDGPSSLDFGAEQEPKEAPAALVEQAVDLEAWANATRRAFYGQKVAVAGQPKLAFPTWSGNVCATVECYSPAPKHLGAGTFGESWLVKLKNKDKKVVIKLLYFMKPTYYTVTKNVEIIDRITGYHVRWETRTETHMGELVPAYVTGQDCVQGTDNYKKVAEALDECNIAQTLHKGSSAPESEKGAQRIMGCYGGNIDQKNRDPRDPLFLLLEDCGGTDLTKFMAEKAYSLTAAQVLALYKQLLEGLAYLASFKNVWIHHDLKPDNLVVKDHGQGKYTLHFIDFGGTVQASSKTQCGITPCTGYFAPPEWFGSSPCHSGEKNFDLSRPDAFDMYSSVSILVQMIMGTYMADVLGPSSKDTARQGFLNHAWIASAIANPSHFVNTYITSARAVAGYGNLANAFHASGQPNQFLQHVLKGLSVSAWDRPKAKDLLQHSAIASIATEDDPDFDGRVLTPCQKVEKSKAALFVDLRKLKCGPGCDREVMATPTQYLDDNEHVAIAFVTGKHINLVTQVLCNWEGLRLQAGSLVENTPDTDEVYVRKDSEYSDGCPQELADAGCAKCLPVIGGPDDAKYCHSLTESPGKLNVHEVVVDGSESESKATKCYRITSDVAIEPQYAIYPFLYSCYK